VQPVGLTGVDETVVVERVLDVEERVLVEEERMLVEVEVHVEVEVEDGRVDVQIEVEVEVVVPQEVVETALPGTKGKRASGRIRAMAGPDGGSIDWK